MVEDKLEIAAPPELSPEQMNKYVVNGLLDHLLANLPLLEPAVENAGKEQVIQESTKISSWWM